MKRHVYFLVALICALIHTSAAQQCLDENGNSVDWWVGLKAPQSAGVSSSGVAAGFVHFYIDANTPTNKPAVFTPSNVPLSDPASPLARTLNNLYKQAATNPDGTGYVFYNDENPLSAGGSVSSSSGHTKGVFGFNDQKQGFWLLHSVPKAFDAPNKTASDAYSYPSNGVQYGQSFVCISIDSTQFDTVGHQLRYYQPQIYGSSLPAVFQSSMPNLTALLAGSTIDVAGSQVVELLTPLGARFTHFAKNGEWNQELYSALVAPYFKVGLFSETWMRPKQASVYPPSVPYSLVNVLTVALPASSKLKTFKYTVDHSKWVVSQNETTPIVCVGGINHQASQALRGGGTACFSSVSLYTAFSSIVASTDPLTG